MNVYIPLRHLFISLIHNGLLNRIPYAIEIDNMRNSVNEFIFNVVFLGKKGKKILYSWCYRFGSLWLAKSIVFVRHRTFGGKEIEKKKQINDPKRILFFGEKRKEFTYWIVASVGIRNEVIVNTQWCPFHLLPPKECESSCGSNYCGTNGDSFVTPFFWSVNRNFV